MRNGNIKRSAAHISAALILIMLGIYLLPLFVPAADDEREAVRVGYYENEVFQEGAEPGAVKTGYAYEYYRKMSEYTGWKYEYVYGDFGDLYQMLIDGEIDLLAGLAWKEERDAIIAYPESPMGNENYSLIKHAADESITVNPATLNGKRLGVLDSAMADALREFLDKHGIEADVISYRDYEPLFDAFDNNEIDVLAAEGDGAYGRQNAELLYAYGASDYYLCVSKARQDLLDELNIAQTELSVDEPNYITFLRSKYYPVSISSRAFSAEEKQWLSEHKTLSIGYLNNYLPYSDIDEEGKVTGLISDMVPRMLESLGIEDITVSYTSFDSYDAMVDRLSSGDIDAVFPVGGGLYYSEESGIYQSGAVVSAATELVYKGDYNDKTTLHFAVNENNRMQYYFVKTYYPEAKISFYPSIDDCLKAVGDGKVGCTTLNGLRANDILRNSKYDGLSLLQTTYDDDRCFGVLIGNEGLLKLLNRGITVLGTDYAQNLAFRYTDKLYSYTFFDMLRNNMAIVGSIILVVAAVIILFLVRDSKRSKREILNKEELIKQQERREQQDKMITALASDYRCVYHVDLDKDDAVCYRGDPTDRDQTAEGVHFSYHDRFLWYADNCVTESYREGFKQFIDPDNIRAALEKETIIMYRYLAHRDGREYYEMIRMAGVRHAENRDDHIVHAVGLGLTSIDTEMRDTMAKNQALSEALKVAEEANKAKTAFLSGMSHEIRTPMNAIIGLDSLALRSSDLSEETREYLEKIGESAKHLLGLINDILDMSRIESGRIMMRKEEFSFSGMLEQLNTMVMSQCNEKGLQYECSVIGGVSDYYIGDDMKLKQILINILSNAIKFTDAPGSIKLTVERTAVFGDHSTVKFVIKDTGIGMDKAYLPKLFDAFSQEDSSSNNKYGSTGLGMAITKNLVELMNGTISVESEKGAGTEFTVVVTLNNSRHEGPATSYVDPGDEKKCALLKGKHILMAEDVMINAEIMEQIILMKEAFIDHAENGRLVTEMFEKSEPGYYDAILMDVRMPEMDGLEAASVIRAMDRPDAKTIPIIALTANAFDEDVQRSLQVGMNAHLSKPVEPEHLYQTLEELIWEAEENRKSG